MWWRYGHSTWQSLADALDNPDDYRAYSVRADARRKAQEAERERAQQEQAERRRQLEAGKWVCPTCQRYAYPEAGLTSGGECRPCLNYRQRTAAGAVPEQADQPPTGGVFGRRRF